MSPRVFRKRPIEIQATRLAPETLGEISRWLDDASFAGGGQDDAGVFVLIRTLEGTMRANEGDWVVRGIRGEFYPVKPGIFDATYEPVEAVGVHA